MKLFSLLPSSAGTRQTDRLQVCFFSATLHSAEVRKYADTLCHRPVWVDLKVRGGDGATGQETGRGLSTANASSPLTPFPPGAGPRRGARDGAPPGGGRRSGPGCGVVVPGPGEAHHGRCALSARRGPDRRRRGCAKRAHQAAEATEAARGSLQRGLGVRPPGLARSPCPAPQVIEALDVDQCLLFCRTNVDCDNLERFLVEVGGGQRFTGKVRPTPVGGQWTRGGR